LIELAICHVITFHEVWLQGSCGSLKVLEFFFQNFKAWKQTWSLKVFESVSEGP